MDERVKKELELLKTRYPNLEFHEEGNWFLIPGFTVPASKWQRESYDVAFQLRPNYPDIGPYGICARPKPRDPEGNQPKDYDDNPSPIPPFGGEWGRFSWEIEDWRAHPDITMGSSLMNYIDSFRGRFEAGR